MHDHELGSKGSKLMKAVRNAGIRVEVAKTWEGDRKLERQLKSQKNSGRFCPICQALKGGEILKNGKRPTIAQRKLMESFDKRIKSDNWLVVKDTPDEMIIVHREDPKNRRTIDKRKEVKSLVQTENCAAK